MTKQARPVEASPSGGGMTMSDIVARHARTVPDGIAFYYRDEQWTWSQTDERISRLANILAELGVRRGDRVATLGLNSVRLMEAMIATLRVGAICVPVNFRLVAGEIAHVLVDSGARVVIADEAFAATVAEVRDRATELTGVITLGEGYEERLAAAAAYAEQDIDDYQPACIMYTSGTTGKAKGAVLSHRNLLTHAYSNIVQMGVRSDDRVGLSGSPLFHIGGVSTFMINLVLGATTVVLHSGRFDAAEVVDLMERHRVSSCFFVPIQWEAICAVPGLSDRDLSALRRISWGAAPATTELLRRMQVAFPQAEIVAVFGQTECSAVTCMLLGEDAIRKIGSVGKPMINVEARIVDDDMRDVPPGTVGEIVYRGPTVMSGYWNRPAETAEVFADGWFHSGDLVRADDDGYLYVVDRKKDMIISGGENIYSAEVENALAAHPKVSDIALIGVPDPKWGEAPLAVIVPLDPADPPSAEEIDAFSRHHLAAYKRPRDIVVVSALPRNATGKVLKAKLRQQYSAP